MNAKMLAGKLETKYGSLKNAREAMKSDGLTISLSTLYRWRNGSHEGWPVIRDLAEQYVRNGAKKRRGA